MGFTAHFEPKLHYVHYVQEAIAGAPNVNLEYHAKRTVHRVSEKVKIFTNYRVTQKLVR